MQRHSFLNHLPRIFRDYEEYRSLGRNADAHISQLDAVFDHFYREQYVQTAEAEGLEQREYDLSIDVQEGDSVELRRRRILAKLQERNPINFAFLRRSLKTLTGSNLTRVARDLEKLEIYVDLDIAGKNEWEAVVDLLERLVPLDMVYHAAVIALQEYLLLHMRGYAFDGQYAFAGHAHTAPENGMGKLLSSLVVEGNIYAFDGNYALTGPQTYPVRQYAHFNDVTDIHTKTSTYAFIHLTPLAGYSTL